jgi:hypothetical protein
MHTTTVHIVNFSKALDGDVALFGVLLRHIRRKAKEIGDWLINVCHSPAHTLPGYLVARNGM